MAFERLPPSRWDRLETLRAQIAGASRSVDRAGYEGALDPAWAQRIVQSLGAALSLCDRARAAGALIQVRPEPIGDSEVVAGAATQPLPTERAHAGDCIGY